MERDGVKREHASKRTFTYKKGDVSLDFTLRIDEKSGLEDFADILKVALQDVTDEIAK